MSAPASATIAGRTVTLPCEVRDASAGSATFLVDRRAAQRLLPSTELTTVSPVPGKALLVLTMIDYRDNDLGDYDELSVALVVRHRGVTSAARSLVDLVRGRLSTWIVHLPVDQPFSCEAGREIWGFPKTVEDLEIRSGDGHATCVWRRGGRDVLRLRVPAGGSRTLPPATLATYTQRSGQLTRTRFTLSGEQARVGLGGADLWVADDPATAALRSLGPPRRALSTTWMGRLRGRFAAPEPVV